MKKYKHAPNGRRPASIIFSVRLEKRMVECMRKIAAQESRTITNLVQVFVSEGVARRSME